MTPDGSISQATRKQHSATITDTPAMIIACVSGSCSESAAYLHTTRPPMRMPF